MFRDVIADETDLRALLGTPSEVAVKKQLARLYAHCRAIIAHAPFVLLATADAQRPRYVSPKADPAGLAAALAGSHPSLPDPPCHMGFSGPRNTLAMRPL